MLILAAVGQTIAMLIVLGLLLFWPAGSLSWPAAWAFLTEMGLASLALSLWLAAKDPQLLAARLAPPVRRAQRPWDRLFMIAALLVVAGWFALMGWDGGRRRLEPLTVDQIAGALCILWCMVMCGLTFAANSFAASVVTLQSDRGHRVITDGPYRVIRHPMYCGALFFCLGAPLLLRSWLGLAVAPILVVGLAARACGEEAFLRTSLTGYVDYARQVRWRFVPFVW